MTSRMAVGTRTTLGALAAGAFFVLGCGGEEKGSQEQQQQAQQKGTVGQQQIKGPEVAAKIVRPKAGATTDSTVTAKVSLTNFELDKQAIGQAPKPGEGHLHFSMDGGRFDFAKFSGPNGRMAQKLGVEGKYSPAVEPEIRYRRLPGGKHTLKVELANNDHSPAGVSTETSFTVK